MDTKQAPSPRTRVRRVARNAHYDRALVHAIADDAFLCHIAFADQHGSHCIPTACWREGDHLYIHGSNGSRMLARLLAADACVTITHVDGLVLARSAFSHSMNYRSLMVYGRFEQVDEATKRSAMDAFMEHLLPGRAADARRGNDKEFAATTVLRIALDEAACKVRSGGPNDDEEDLALDVWAGVLPLRTQRLAPQRHEACGTELPDYLQCWA